MFSLLRSECYQVKKSFAVRITVVVLTVASFIMSFEMLSSDYAEFYEMEGMTEKLYGAGSVMGTMSDSAMGLLIASLFSGFLISAAFENRIVQEAVSYGKTREKVFFAKMLAYLAASTLTIVLYWFVGSIGAFMKNGFGTEDTVGSLCHVDIFLGMLAAEILAYCSLYVICGVVGFICKRSGVTIGICLIAILVGGNLLAMLMSSMPENVQNIISYTPLQLNQHVLKTDVNWNDIISTGLISLLWIAAVCGIGIYHFKRDELK